MSDHTLFGTDPHTQLEISERARLALAALANERLVDALAWTAVAYLGRDPNDVADQLSMTVDELNRKVTYVQGVLARTDTME